ncbi:hypothetical protein [Acinetobacter radioresistens]|uniref:hypothetical protein n=1 Tax=Acinetobacter radioresistens TaxID=40216 RepID=UPI000946307A|nr:hypothetical protein [Acinetobacter radioresistens]
MLTDFIQTQEQQFFRVAEKIMNEPERYLQFDSISDFYKAVWLVEFPKGTVWSASGLDDGAEEFYAIIEYRKYTLNMTCTGQNTVCSGISRKDQYY